MVASERLVVAWVVAERRVVDPLVDIAFATTVTGVVVAGAVMAGAVMAGGVETDQTATVGPLGTAAPHRPMGGGPDASRSHQAYQHDGH